MSGRAWRTEYQKAVGVWPESVRPERSVIVPEIISGRRTPVLGEDLLDREDRRLGVERVEDRLEQDEVGAAVDQAARRLAIGRDEIVEGDGAEAGIVDVGRDRGGAVGRADGAGDEARPVRRLARSTMSAGLAGEPRALAVQLVGEPLHAVVGLGDRGRGEGVGLDDVGAGAEIVDDGWRGSRPAGSGSGDRCCRGGRAASRRSASPRKSASLRRSVWISVPIAPSRTRMRLAAIGRKRACVGRRDESSSRISYSMTPGSTAKRLRVCTTAWRRPQLLDSGRSRFSARSSGGRRLPRHA